ncbi:hypothetical protein BLNAU_17182 [Blattamonas nauphoetae]|uniref:Uncharacterized protein n=1 Tax=Blattamonas nauphoetae TaxID=2049346 RepID=A0ABQ9X7Q0_9EUKA|nr:hypothetical protein BLNAU_17182 [Blattamonas nauphoetae]
MCICVTQFPDDPVASHDYLFLKITQETFVKSFTIIDNEDQTATFEIEVGDAVTGEMVVVVDNLEGTRSSPPPITRSLTFSFPTAETTASCIVAVGDDELFQSPAPEYKLRRAAVADWLVHTLRVTPKSQPDIPAAETVKKRGEHERGEGGGEADGRWRVVSRVFGWDGGEAHKEYICWEAVSSSADGTDTATASRTGDWRE